MIYCYSVIEWTLQCGKMGCNRMLFSYSKVHVHIYRIGMRATCTCIFYTELAWWKGGTCTCTCGIKKCILDCAKKGRTRNLATTVTLLGQLMYMYIFWLLYLIHVRWKESYTYMYMYAKILSRWGWTSQWALDSGSSSLYMLGFTTDVNMHDAACIFQVGCLQWCMLYLYHAAISSFIVSISCSISSLSSFAFCRAFCASDTAIFCSSWALSSTSHCVLRVKD